MKRNWWRVALGALTLVGTGTNAAVNTEQVQKDPITSIVQTAVGAALLIPSHKKENEDGPPASVFPPSIALPAPAPPPSIPASVAPAGNEQIHTAAVLLLGYALQLLKKKQENE